MIRFLTGGLATVALTSVCTLVGPAAHAEDRPCGQPPVDPTYTTVVHEPVFRDVPAVTHDEWLWQRVLDIVEQQYSTVETPASVEIDWSRSVPGPLETRYSKIVVDKPAVPAVPAVPAIPAVGHFETVIVTPAVTVLEAEFRQRHSGKTRWELPTWDNEGWSKTGNTRTREIKPAVTTTVWVIDKPAVPGIPAIPAIPAVTHVEYLWSATVPGEPWTSTGETRPGTPILETTTTTGATPTGEGWTKVATRDFPAVLAYNWAEVIPDGGTATGMTRIAGTRTQTTDKPSASAPEGTGWAKVLDSVVTVVDQEASTELVSEGYTETVLDDPGLPATDPCVEPPVIDPGNGEDNAIIDDDAVVIVDAGTEVAPPTAPDRVQAAPAVVSEVLPNTGGAPAWMAPAGLATVLLGAVMVRNARRRAIDLD